MGESFVVGSWSRIETEERDVISRATSDGGSGGRAWANPRTSFLRVLALRLHAIACLSLSPPAQPEKLSYKQKFSGSMPIFTCHC